MFEMLLFHLAFIEKNNRKFSSRAKGSCTITTSSKSNSKLRKSIAGPNIYNKFRRLMNLPGGDEEILHAPLTISRVIPIDRTQSQKEEEKRNMAPQRSQHLDTTLEAASSLPT